MNELDRLRELLDKMTEGPWYETDHTLPNDLKVMAVVPVDETRPGVMMGCPIGSVYNATHDARGIAATHNVIGALLDELEAHRAFQVAASSIAVPRIHSAVANTEAATDDAIREALSDD